MSGARGLRWPRLLGAQLAAAVLLALVPPLGLLVARSGSLFATGASRPVGSSANPFPTMATGELPRAAVGPVSAAIGAVEPSYRVHPSPSGAAAVNRGQGFAVSFTSNGVSVSSGSLGLALRTTAAGFGGSQAALAPATPQPYSNRVTYDRPGVQEWYANGPFGLEQGFTVEQPAASEPQPGTYTVAMTVSGTAPPVLAADGSSVVLSSPSGRALRYSGLRAVDAARRLLPSWMSLSGHTLSLHVDTAGASFPVSIDPTVTEEGPFFTGEGLSIELGEGKGEAPEKPQFGAAVALSGDGTTALVGAPDGESHTGAAWIFHREGAVWTQQGEKLTGSTSEEEGACEGEEVGAEEPVSCAFGSSVALSYDGGVALIGAPAHGSKPGVAWVYNRSGSKWPTEGELLTGPTETGQEDFGFSVALSSDGNHALVGAPTEHGGRGAAYVFERVGPESPWGSGAALVGTGEGPGGHLGFSVALSADGQQAIAGAPLDDLHKGTAFVFEHGTTWAQNGSPLSGSGESGEGRFGESVAMASNGSTVLVGAPAENSREGAVWSFVFVTGRWNQFGAKLVGKGYAKEEFGRGLALSGDGTRALVGAPKTHAEQRGEGAGSVVMYTASKSEWNETQTVEAGPLEKGNGQFGKSVAMTQPGETILVGAPHESDKAGAVWLFGERPLVEEVTPPTEKGHAKGHLDGGNKVLIIGRNISAALAVWFGPYKAGPERIVERQTAPSGGKEKLLVEVPPADEATEVDVTVETADWLSAVNSNDGYTYVLGPAEEGGGGGGGGSGPKNKKGREPGVPIGDILNPPSTGTTTATKPSGGVAGSTSNSAACTVALRSSKISVASHTHAELALAAHGSGHCGGHISLQVSVKKGKHTELQTIASGTYSATAGHNFVVTLKLGRDRPGDAAVGPRAPEGEAADRSQHADRAEGVDDERHALVREEVGPERPGRRLDRRGAVVYRRRQ